MRFSLGFWDWLSGEKIQLDLGDGRTVTKRWWLAMQTLGKVRPIPLGKNMITVHSIGRTPEFDNPDDLDKWMINGSKTYQMEAWEIGMEVSESDAAQWKDPETGDLYVIYQIVDGKWKYAFCTREVFKKFQAVMGGR